MSPANASVRTVAGLTGRAVVSFAPSLRLLGITLLLTIGSLPLPTPMISG
jgi:hypothetical protein